MKKFFSVLTIVAVISLGVVGALAVVPHVHGKDLDHSKHETCPVYQFSLQNLNAAIASFISAAVLFLFFYFIHVRKSFSFAQHFSSVSLRAPPVLV